MKTTPRCARNLRLTAAPSACVLSLLCLLLFAHGTAHAVEGPDAAVIAALIDTGGELSTAYGSGEVCPRLSADRERLAGIREQGGISMRRLLGVVEKAQEADVRESFSHALRSIQKLERTLDGAGEMCRLGDERVVSTGYIYRMQDDAEILAEAGLRLCRSLREALPRFTWPACSRP